MAPVDHPWDLSPAAAAALQLELRRRLVLQPLEVDPATVAGVDVGFPKGRGIARAAIAVLSYPALELVETVAAEVPLTFPYIPGLLSFREAPAVLAAWQQLQTLPEVLIFDGHGRAHPRRFGLACHLGVLLDRPTIGCAKSLLVGTAGSLAEAVGSTARVVHEGEAVGAALRTRRGVKPVYVSAGHRMDLASAVRLVLGCGGSFRLPEPTRLADKLASARGGGSRRSSVA